MLCAISVNWVTMPSPYPPTLRHVNQHAVKASSTSLQPCAMLLAHHCPQAYYLLMGGLMLTQEMEPLGARSLSH